jgi:2-polyprenyl-3-methyl-5-hydroxy-6-metoxy-1,4-benzoquinol methylase
MENDKSNQTKEASWYYQCQRPEMLKYITKPSCKVLEVGCGTGAFGAQLRELLGAEVWGVEPSSESVETATSRLNKFYHSIYIDTLPLPEHYFDYVIFNDVLEHMAEPDIAIQLARIHLNAGGLLVASIPNVRYFPVIWNLVVKRDWKYEDSGVLDRTHLRFFTESSLRELFRTLSYDLQVIEGINPIQGHTKYNFLRLFLNSKISDMQYPQFAIVAKPHGKS